MSLSNDTNNLAISAVCKNFHPTPRFKASANTARMRKMNSVWPFSFPVFEVPILSEIGLHLFIGPSCANLSLLRLLLLINIVSLSKVSNYLSSGLSFGLHLSLGPCFGLLRWTTSVLTDSEGQKGHFLAAATFEGLETFWDLGCCLLYFCLWLLIKVHQIPKKKAKNSRIR